jgi:hypothetical protein
VDALPVDAGEAAWPIPIPTSPVAPPTGRPEMDAPTERLPIYEAVLSQWFRADEASAAHGMVPTNGVHDAGTVIVPEAVAPIPVPEPPTSGRPNAAGGGLPTRVPGRAGAAAGFGTSDRMTSDAPSLHSNGAANGSSYAESNGAGDAWQTPADEGWSRAEALLAPVSETTTAGLPKRVPKAHLVPGSAAPRSESTGTPAGGRGRQVTSAPPSLPPRTADAVRGRMSSFQQGLRRGRHTLIEAYSGEASHSSAHRADEEQE